VICHLRFRGWIERREQGYELTEIGRKKAERVIRLHRLWEVYLVDYMGQSVEKVHRNAEELEHLFTPEFERELTALLKDPKKDPHHQPIPAGEGLL
jgi:manganese/zinc/iron transport system permease protein